MTDLAASFRKPFGEQVAAYRLRLGNLVPTSRWDDLRHAQHDRAFMVAGAVKADLLADLAAAVESSIVQGTTLETFRKDFRSIVEKHGWHGWTGEGTAKGEAWRTRVIWRTNMATSYAAGRMAQLVDGKFRFWVYRHGNAREPRLQHLAWDGVALAPDHPFWQTHAPPNGWGCTCRIRGTNSEAGIRRVGGDPDKALPDGWQDLDAKTGAPQGIDKGWDYAPGASVADTLQSMTAKTVAWPFELASAYMQAVPEAVADDFARGLRSLPSLREATRRYAERILGERNGAAIPGPVVVEPRRTLGLATSDLADWVAREMDRQVRGFDFSIDPSGVRHAIRTHGTPAVEAARGQIAVTAADFGLIPDIINHYDLIENAGVSDVGHPVIRFTRTIGDRTYVLAMEIRGAKRRKIALQSLWIRASGRSPT
ncbi:phage minor head protein [Paracoccaceae bacterium Fryx2]|nr:phage minor head protein [Paracoccaceae bacterium Fryx2]